MVIAAYLSAEQLQHALPGGRGTRQHAGDVLKGERRRKLHRLLPSGRRVRPVFRV